MRKYGIISNYKEEGYSRFNNVPSWIDWDGVIYKVYCLDEYNIILSMDFPMWYR